MNETSTENAMFVESVPNYLRRYAAEVELWRQESVVARANRTR